ncbi:MAG: putative toxin-antitoxin system toxin component, PIN family [Lentisphaerae bacterium]|nr:putative toxin-antitoxin system toxin component, PIN family [Lentisphaerota bacterium]
MIASATATRGLCADVLRTVIEFHELVVSEHLLGELQRILKDKFGSSPDLVDDVVQLLHQDTVMAASQPLLNVALKDVDDIAIITSAVNGGAELLVTGDKEMLTLKRVGTLDIITPRQFWERERGLSGRGE